MTNLNLLYPGGSGGFVLLHFLLLSDQYLISFLNKKRFQEAFEQQWQIPDSNYWKATESWPDNLATHQLATDKNKIYFYCNPYQRSTGLGTYCQFNVALYTDYNSQLKLAYYKKAWIYHGVSKPSQDPKFTAMRSFLRHWKSHYENLRDPSWPDYVSLKKINSLSTHIKNDILQDPHTQKFLQYQYQKPIKEFNSEPVFDLFYPYLQSADVVIKLQDFINSRGQIVVDALKLSPVNAQQYKFIDRWINLHPPELLDCIGINT